MNAGVDYTRVASNMTGTFSNVSYSLVYQLTFNYKDLSVFYIGNIVDWQLSGTFMKTNEKFSIIGAQYQYKNFDFAAMCRFFLADPVYKTRTIDDSAVKFNATNIVNDGKNMVAIGFAYRFNIGKKSTSAVRYLNNEDNDSGVISHD